MISDDRKPRKGRPLTERERTELPVTAVASGTPIVRELLAVWADCSDLSPDDVSGLCLWLVKSAAEVRSGLIRDYGYDPEHGTATTGRQLDLAVMQFVDLTIKAGMYASYWAGARAMFAEFKASGPDRDTALAAAKARWITYAKDEALAVSIAAEKDLFQRAGWQADLLATYGAAWVQAGADSNTSALPGRAVLTLARVQSSTDANAKDAYARVLERIYDARTSGDLVKLPGSIKHVKEYEEETEVNRARKRQRDCARRKQADAVSKLPGIVDIDTVASIDSAIDPLQHVLAQESRAELDCIRNVLARREREVLDYILEGLTETDIAERMGVEIGTVRSWRGRIFKKARDLPPNEKT